MDNKKKFEQLISILENLQDPRFVGLARIFRLRLEKPEAYITLTGETSAGKTTLINSLLQEKLLKVGAKPTTGTVTQIRCEADIKGKEYYAINRDGTLEEIEKELFAELLVKPDKDLLRLLLKFPHEKYKGINIFDTPGFNSLTHGHQEVLEEFLPESDIILFVCNYRSGFGQNEQDLLELIRKVVVLDPEMPILLIVNRVPKNKGRDDKRIKEMLCNASDCLFKEPPLLLIQSKNPDLGLPDTEKLWQYIDNIIQDSKRQKFVQGKINQLGLDLLREARTQVHETWLAMGLSQDEKRFLLEQLNEFEQTKKEANRLIEKFQEKMQRNLPKIIERELKQIKKNLDADIDSENKWLNKDTCISFLEEYALPQNIKVLSKNVEQYIFDELEKLNKKLEDLINTTIQKLENQAKLKGGNVENLVSSIAARIAQELGGRAITGMLKGVGGVGGAAAGAGNLAKMAISRIGRLFGVTFKREIYNNIGRFFNAKMLARLTVLFQVVIEVLLYVVDAKTWQKKLKKQLHTTLDKWEEEVQQNLFEEVIVNCTKNNKTAVFELVSEFETDIKNKLNSEDNDLKKGKLKKLIQQFDKLEKVWSV